MFKVEIELPESIRVPLSDTGKFTEVPIKQIASHPHVLRFAVCAGFEGALANISRGKDDNGKANSDAVFAATREKRMKPWIDGADSWGSTERGESAYTAMREAWVDDYRARAKASNKEAESFIRAKVTERLGKDTKATFANFIAATALDIVDAKQAKDTDEATVMIETQLGAMVEAARAEREAVAAKVAVPAFDLSAFKKAK